MVAAWGNGHRGRLWLRHRVVRLLQNTATLPAAVGSGSPTIHRCTAWGQWAMELLRHTATLPAGSGQWNSCNILPHCLGAVGNGTPTIHRRTAWGHWAVDLPQYIAALPGGSGRWNSCNILPLLRNTAKLPWGSGQWNSCNTPPCCLGAMGSGSPAIHRRTAWWQWAMKLPRHVAILPGGRGWNPLYPDLGLADTQCRQQCRGS